MWYVGEQRVETHKDFNAEVRKIKDNLPEEEARILLAKFLRHNIGFTWEFFTGFRLYPIQELIIKIMLMYDVGCFIAGRGGSKCTSYSEYNYLLEKNKGLVNIPSLLPKVDFSKGERWEDIPTINLWNGKDFVSVNKLLIQPQKKTLKIKTRMGYEIEGSDRHLLKSINTQNDNCNLVWKRSHELKTGDYLCIDRNECFYGEEITQEEKDEAYLIGLLVGDGSLREAGWCITNADDEILNFCQRYSNSKLIKDKRSKAFSLRFPNKFRDYIKEKYNLKCCLSYHKEIPKTILKNRNLLRECLKGLFDSDGYAATKTKKVGFCSVSHKLAKQVHLALLNFGIISSLKKRKTNSKFGIAYIIGITGKDLIKFSSKIGFNLVRKQKILDQHLLNHKKFNTNIDVIPGAKEKLTKIRNDNCIQEYKLRQINPKHHTNQDCFNLSRSKTIEQIKTLKSAGAPNLEFENLEDILNQNYFFDEIVSIEEGVEDCVDFNIPNGECYWGNGFINHNSFIISIFSIIYPVMFPGRKACLVSANFRGSRRMLEEAEGMLRGEGAALMKQCFPNALKRSNDQYKIILPNESEVFALPLSEQIRGARAQALLVDEGLLVNKEMQNAIIRPFLAARANLQEEMQITEHEDSLVRQGLMTDDERTELSKNKYFTLSSASYEFEYLYEQYCQYIKFCNDPGKIKLAKGQRTPPRYFSIRMSYKCIEDLPHNGWLDMSQISAAAADGGDQTASFKREYEAEFSRGSDGFFNVKKMYNCIIPFGEEPTVQIVGNSQSKYILAIDPSYSFSKDSDFFAMGVYMLIPEDRRVIQVHSFGRSGMGGDTKGAYEYLVYVLENFNIEMISIDASGTEFITGFNESTLAHDRKLKLGLLNDFKLDSTDLAEYDIELRRFRNEINLLEKRIVYPQKFNSGSIRTMNERLQGLINSNKVWFGSRMQADDKNAAKYMPIMQKYKMKTRLGAEYKDDIMAYIDDQNEGITQTISQTALIEISSSKLGTQSFDLPQNLRRSKDVSRPRKDNYTCLLIAITASYHIFNLWRTPEEEEEEAEMTPTVIR